MSLSVPPLNRDEQALLDALPADGSSIGNVSLQRWLRWRADRYFIARDALADAGLLFIGRGRGGSVRLAVEDPTQGPTVSVTVSPGRRSRRSHRGFDPK